MSIYENRSLKIRFFWCQGIFSLKFDFKMCVKINLRRITKHAANPEIGFTRKIDFEAVWQQNGHSVSVGVKHPFYENNFRRTVWTAMQYRV